MPMPMSARPKKARRAFSLVAVSLISLRFVTKVPGQLLSANSKGSSSTKRIFAMKFNLYLLSDSLVTLLLEDPKRRGLNGHLFDTVYNAYKPQVVDKQIDDGVESKKVRDLGTPTAQQAAGLREIVGEIKRLHEVLVSGSNPGDVAVILKTFVKAEEKRRDAVSFIEKKLFPKAVNRLGKSTVEVVYPTSDILRHWNGVDHFATLLLPPAAAQSSSTSSSKPLGAPGEEYGRMPTGPEQMYSATNLGDYGVVPPPAGGDYGNGPPETSDYEAVHSRLAFGTEDMTHENDATVGTDANDAAYASTSQPREEKRSDDNDED
jgi:hypothetical protein